MSSFQNLKTFGKNLILQVTSADASYVPHSNMADRVCYNIFFLTK